MLFTFNFLVTHSRQKAKTHRQLPNWRWVLILPILENSYVSSLPAPVDAHIQQQQQHWQQIWQTDIMIK